MGGRGGGSRGFKTMVSNANLSAETNLFRENYLKALSLKQFYNSRQLN